MLYLISLIGFVTDKLGVFRRGRQAVIDLLFNIVLPIANLYIYDHGVHPGPCAGDSFGVCVRLCHPPGGRRAGTAVLSPPQSHGAGRVPATVCCSPTPAFWRCLWLWR